MPYNTILYKLDKLETPDKKLAIVRARILAREQKVICYVDIIQRRMLNAKEAKELHTDSIEYSLLGRIEVSPRGSVIEL